MSTEKFTISSDEVVAKVKKLIHEGNIRRVRVLYKGKVMIEMPLTVGVTGAALGIMVAPLLAALGAVAALVTECTIEVERVDKPEPPPSETGENPKL